MIAVEVALAFNTANTRKSWIARPNSRDAGDTVLFTAPTNLVALVLHCSTGQYEVRFNKFQAAWGDYIKSIARSLYVVLSTLKASGMDMEAPETYVGMEVVTTATDSALTFVRWGGADKEKVQPSTE